ncbi:adenosine deaminase [Amycolatopsis sp. NPDC054798]
MSVLPCVPPKVELHLHLDCCLSYACTRALRPQTSLAEYLHDYAAPAKCGDLVDFLRRPTRLVELMQTEAALRLVTDDLFAQLLADNVVYAEIRFAPLLHTDGGLTAAQVVDTVEAAVAEASAATGVWSSVILCTLRHYTREQSMTTARLAAERLDGGVITGLDLAGDEAGFGLDAHVDAFRFAREHGVRLTAHAGEARGAASVTDVLDRLRPERIGHGVRSIEDPATVQRLASEGTHLEVCPTSNVQTMGTIVPAYRDHPIDALKRAKVAVSVNTDARTVSRVTLDQEYARLRQAFGWTDADFADCNRAAIDASFTTEETKQTVRALLAAPGRAEAHRL